MEDNKTNSLVQTEALVIRQITIRNFRGIAELSLNLDETTVLIGGNNTGKSTILAAVQSCLNRSFNRRDGVFGEYDYHLKNKDGQPTEAAPIEIILTFSESREGTWPDEVDQLLDKAVGLEEDGRRCITIFVKSGYDETTKGYVTTATFLNPKGQPLPTKTLEALRGLQNLVPIFYLGALRDVAREFRPNSPFWGPFVRAMKIDPERRMKIESELEALNKQVLDAHTAFNDVCDRLGKASKMVPLGGGPTPVSIEAIPGKIFDILAKTQVMLTGKTGANLPLDRHGEGTQSLAVICLFDAFLNLQQFIGENKKTSNSIVALEEPEAHLHPSAIRAVGNMLKEFKGQKIISTHSGDLLGSVPLSALRRLSRVDGTIRVHQIDLSKFSDDDLRRLEHHIRRHRGHFLFANMWLLVEGETDELVFQEAARILGYDLFSKGVCCFEFTKVGVVRFIKLADHLGIDWLVVADSDKAGKGYVDSVKDHLGKRKESEYIRQLPAENIEIFLCNEGLGSVYEANISPQKKDTITAQKGALDYWAQVVGALPSKGKPRIAAEAMDELERVGVTAMPYFLRESIEMAVQRAKEAE